MSNGWSTNYYQIPEGATEIQDLIEYKGMNFSKGNILKAVYRMGEKGNTSALYDINKIIWFAEREKARLEALEGEQLELPLDEYDDEESVDVEHMSTYDMVEEFHRAFGGVIDEPLVVHDPIIKDTLDLRVRLMFEELTEFSKEVRAFNTAIDDTKEAEEHLIKELCDVLYVVLGTMVSLDVDWSEAFTRVHLSNMSKLGADGYPVYREDGKILKGPNYFEPDLSDLVEGG